MGAVGAPNAPPKAAVSRVISKLRKEEHPSENINGSIELFIIILK